MNTTIRILIDCGCKSGRSVFQFKAERLNHDGLAEDLRDELDSEGWVWDRGELVCPDCAADLEREQSPYFTFARDLSRLQAQVNAEPNLRRQS